MSQLESDSFVLLARQGETLAAVAGLLAELVSAVGGLDMAPSISVPPATVVVGEGDGTAAAVAVRDALAPLLSSLNEAVGALATKLDDLATRMAKAPSSVVRGGAGVTDVQLRAAPLAVTNPDAPDLTGAWSYYAGAAGAVVVVGRVVGITAHATTAGTVTINGGAAIPVPAGSSFSLAPGAQLVDPTVVFTGTDGYAIEVLA